MKMIKLLFNILLALFIGAGAQTYLGANPLIVAGGVLAAGAVLPFVAKEVKNVAYMAVVVEIWQDHIENEIFKANGFVRKSTSADEYIQGGKGGKVVHIPQSGGSGNVVKNRSSFPATVRDREDTDVIYLLDSHSSDPVRIPWRDEMQLSYDKRQSVLGEDMDKINQVVAEGTLLNWVKSPVFKDYGATALPAANKILTTGANRAATALGATGNRRAGVLNDLQRMATYFKSIDRWFEGKMHALLTPQMQADMFPADSVITATYMQNVTEEERRAGIMYKCQGWNIWGRSTVLRTDTDLAFREPGEAGAATDNTASLFWYENAVEFAFSGVQMFFQEKAPQFYGDVYSLETISGGRAKRADYKGVGVLIEAPAV